MPGPWSVTGRHHAAANKHASSALWMDALLPTPAPLVDGGSHAAMRPHLDDHAAGTLQGAIPAAYCAAHSLDHCRVCGLLVAARFNGAHPRCRPAARDSAAPAAAAAAAGNGGGPDMAALFLADIPVLRHVPRVARASWAQCLARALAAVAHHNSAEAWWDLLMLPKAVLRPAPRGGALRRQQAGQFTLRRCGRWLGGEREELLEAHARPRGRRPAHRAPEDSEDPVVRAQQSRCCALAGEGELSRACAALVAPPLLNHNADTVTKLRSKHPQAAPARPALVPLGPPSTADVPDITAEQIRRAIQGWSRSSTAGLTGLRGDHLKEALATAHADEVLVHLTGVVQLLVRGDAPADLAQHLAGATLHALPKGQDDVRPIAVGETLRRLASMCLCQAMRDSAQDLLAPLQVGVAVPLGGEAAVHTARQWMYRRGGHATDVFLKVDFHNAFNTVDRAALLRQVRLHLPGLAPWAEWCYSCHSRLLFHGDVFTSEAGVQQGDPLGPLLFALALQPAMQAAKAGPLNQSPHLIFAYLDNVCLAGDYRAVAASFARLAAAARQVGLHINLAKSELIPCGGPDSAIDRGVFPPDIAINPTTCFTLLGAPIGGAAFCEQQTVAQRVDKARPLLDAIAELPEPQTGLLLLRHCASFCKVVYATRVTPSTCLGSAMETFDTAVRHCLEAVCTGPLSAEAWLQASLATTAGGLGLRHACIHAPAGYASSVLATQPLCQQLDPDYLPSSAEGAIQAVNRLLPAGDQIPVPAPPPLRQRQLSQALDKVLISRLTAAGPGREAFRAHFQLLQQPGAGAWLHAPPSPALGLHVAGPLFKIMVRLRLRLQVALGDAPCPMCDGVADSYGDHARVCPCGGDRTKRHHSQGLVTVPFWEYWTSPYSSHYRPYT